jgi:Integrase zinc binding domain
MPDTTLDACLMACAIAYTRHAPDQFDAGILNIAADQSLLDAIITGYETDDFTKQLTKDIAMGSIEGATLTDKLLYVGRRLVIPQDLAVRELLYNLAHDTLGHFGFDKSYEALHGSYYWPNMRRDLEKVYIPSCSECQRNKNRTSKPTGPLHPLPVPDDRFDTVALDFIGPLLEEDGKDTILTMTDPLGANIRIAGTQFTYTAAQITIVLFNEWYCENSLMLHLVSD